MSKPIDIKQHTIMELCLHFCPNSIGNGVHQDEYKPTGSQKFLDLGRLLDCGVNGAIAGPGG
jgi:hypothetical protein